jgi:hypothetical protein
MMHMPDLISQIRTFISIDNWRKQGNKWSQTPPSISMSETEKTPLNPTKRVTIKRTTGKRKLSIAELKQEIQLVICIAF